MTFVVDDHSIKVRHQSTVAIVRVQGELAEGCIMNLCQPVQVHLVRVIVPHFRVPVGPRDQSYGVQAETQHIHHLTLHLTDAPN